MSDTRMPRPPAVDATEGRSGSDPSSTTDDAEGRQLPPGHAEWLAKRQRERAEREAVTAGRAGRKARGHAGKLSRIRSETRRRRQR